MTSDSIAGQIRSFSHKKTDNLADLSTRDFTYKRRHGGEASWKEDHSLRMRDMYESKTELSIESVHLWRFFPPLSFKMSENAKEKNYDNITPGLHYTMNYCKVNMYRTDTVIIFSISLMSSGLLQLLSGKVEMDKL